MNARHPVLSFYTADPVADAARYEDACDAEQNAHEALLAEALNCAPAILLAQMQALKKPSDWFKNTVNARGLRSFDDLLCEAMGEDDATNSAVGELMIGAASVQEVHKAVAEFAGHKYALDIYLGAGGRH